MTHPDSLTRSPPAETNATYAAPHAATYAVTQVRLDPGGRIADVWWNRVDGGSNRSGGNSKRAPVAAVVRAIRAGVSVVARPPGSGDAEGERRYVVADHEDGHPTIVLEDAGRR